MPKYTATAKVFRDGGLLQIGDEIESPDDPGAPFVPSETYQPFAHRVENVPRQSGFILSNGEMAGTATRLSGVNPNEWRY